MAIRINQLSRRQIHVLDHYFTFIKEMPTLTKKEQDSIFERLDMLHLTTPASAKMLRAEIERCNDTSGRDRRFK